VASIYADIRLPDLSIAAAWDDLVRRADGNVFMSPAALVAANISQFAKIHVLQAWDQSSEPRLVGLWALQEKTLVPFGPTVLAAPPYDYAFLSTPVIDPVCVEEVIVAFFDAIANHPKLPNVMRLKYLDGDSRTFAAMLHALAARGSPDLLLARRQRPHVSREFGVKRSGSTRKKLRQDWNRLSTLGSVQTVNDRGPAGVRDAFEIFLRMEAESWKGAQGTALLCDEADTAFAREFVARLAIQDSASVALLLVDGLAVAAQVLLYCGSTAYTWKTAFDASFGRFSPGALLVDRVTDELLSTGTIEAIESCSPDGGFMAQLWDGRRTTVDALIDVGQGKSFGFALAALTERTYARLRMLRHRLRTAPSDARGKDTTTLLQREQHLFSKGR
jgi:CelD/BcsL family acetyltransferase involved in cellulose biosynthesis